MIFRPLMVMVSLRSNNNWNNVNVDRLNKRQRGTLKGRGWRRARRIVNMFGSIYTSGEYGSIEINEKDFVPFEDKK